MVDVELMIDAGVVLVPVQEIRSSLKVGRSRNGAQPAVARRVQAVAGIEIVGARHRVDDPRHLSARIRPGPQRIISEHVEASQIAGRLGGPDRISQLIDRRAQRIRIRALHAREVAVDALTRLVAENGRDHLRLGNGPLALEQEEEKCFVPHYRSAQPSAVLVAVLVVLVDAVKIVVCSLPECGQARPSILAAGHAARNSTTD